MAEDLSYVMNDFDGRVRTLEQRIPIGGSVGTVLVKTSAPGAPLTMGWVPPPGQLVAYKMGTATGVILNYNQPTNATPLHIFSTNMVAGRMYLLQFTFRAITSNRGMYAKLQKNAADYPGPYDTYVVGGAESWCSANICWLIPGTGNTGVVGWRLQCWSQDSGVGNNSQVYNDQGGFAACWDVGVDPGAQ